MAKEGTLRLLTPGEVRLGREVFSETITWHKVWIHHNSYLPLGLQNQKVAMSPWRNILSRMVPE